LPFPSPGDLPDPGIELIDTKTKLVALNLANHKHKILHQIRLDYFKAKLFQEQIEQAKRYLKTVEKVALISEKKYLQGLIQVSAKNRTMLAKIKQHQSINSLRELYKGQLSLLAINTEKKDLQPGSLVTPLPRHVNVSFLPSTFQNSFLAKRLEIKNEEIENNRSLDRSKLFPDIYLAYQNNLGSELGSRYLVGVSWNLSSERYFNHRSFGFEKRSNFQNLKSEARFGNLKYNSLLSQIRSNSTKLTSQEEMTNIYKKVSSDSLKQYHKGILPLKDYYEDFTLLIAAESALLQLRFDTVELIANLSLLVEDDALFYKGLML